MSDPWLVSAANLLRGDEDPGATPFQVEHLLVEDSLAALVGAWKVGKTWVGLDLAVSIATGRRALGRLEVDRPGPAIVVVEESGLDALRRRLAMLARGRGLAAQDLGGLWVSANRNVRLDSPDWQRRLLEAAKRIEPRLVVLDPLVRMKAAGRNENLQGEMAVVTDYLRELRDAAGSAVMFSHHLGHAGEHMRGSSDLEAFWESRIAVRRSGNVLTLAAEHREAESSPAMRFGMRFEDESVRFVPMEDDDDESSSEEELEEAILAAVGSLGDPTGDALERAVSGWRAERIRFARGSLLERGALVKAPKRSADRGRTARYALPGGSSSGSSGPSEVVPDELVSSSRPDPHKGRDGTSNYDELAGDEVDERARLAPGTLPGDEDYLRHLRSLHVDRHLTSDERRHRKALHDWLLETRRRATEEETVWALVELLDAEECPARGTDAP